MQKLVSNRHLRYDGSFEGLLTVVFTIYEQALAPASIEVFKAEDQVDLFTEVLEIPTDKRKAVRVRKGLSRINSDLPTYVYRNFLTELPGVELLIYRICKRVFAEQTDVSKDFSDPDILRMHQLDKKLFREEHRMHAFVRFQETKDGLFVSTVNPDFNVLPILAEHFVPRYPAFPWLIFDLNRRYGLHYDQKEIRFTTLENDLDVLPKDLLTEAEVEYQDLWKTYFKSVDIVERRNMKLHLQHVPRRYWPYLVEK